MVLDYVIKYKGASHEVIIYQLLQGVKTMGRGINWTKEKRELKSKLLEIFNDLIGKKG